MHHLKKGTIICVLISTIFYTTACSNKIKLETVEEDKIAISSNGQVEDQSKQIEDESRPTESSKRAEHSKASDASEVSDIAEASYTSEISEPSKLPESSDTKRSTSNTNTTSNTDSITKETIDYILNGQENAYGASALKWDENFLNKVDIQAVYKDYIASGGKKDDVQAFTQYLTNNAPIPADWQEMLTESIKENYDVNVTRFELIEGVSYSVYVTLDGQEVNYLTANARTGDYHG